jgi:hypothetical protein
MTKVERFDFEDAPRRQPLAADPIPKGGFALQHEHLETGPGQHRRGGGATETSADDDNIERLVLRHFNPPFVARVWHRTRTRRPLSGPIA